MIEPVALLLTGFLFGGMTLFSAGFASALYKALPAERVGVVLRTTFPRFYAFVIVAALAAAVPLWPSDALGAAALGLVGLTTVPVRQILTPAINRATDTGDESRFKRLHALAVAVTLAHIMVAGWVLTRFVA